MNRLLPVILFLFFLSCRKDTSKTILLFNDYQEALNGNAKQLIETTSVDMQNNHSSDTTIFDEKGNTLEMFVNSLGRHYIIKYTNEYNANGSKKAITGRGGKRKQIYTYDFKGRLIRLSFYDANDSLQTKTLYKYDTSGNTIESDTYLPNLVLNHSQEYGYDSKHLLKEINGFPYKLEYQYVAFDSKNNWIKRIATGYNFDKPNNIQRYTTTRKITYY